MKSEWSEEKLNYHDNSMNKDIGGVTIESAV